MDSGDWVTSSEPRYRHHGVAPVRQVLASLAEWRAACAAFVQFFIFELAVFGYPGSEIPNRNGKRYEAGALSRDIPGLVCSRYLGGRASERNKEAI